MDFNWLFIIWEWILRLDKIDWWMRDFFFLAICFAFRNRLIYLLSTFNWYMRILFWVRIVKILCFNFLCLKSIEIVSEFSFYTVSIYVRLFLRLWLIFYSLRLFWYRNFLLLLFGWLIICFQWLNCVNFWNNLLINYSVCWSFFAKFFPNNKLFLFCSSGSHNFNHHKFF